MFKNFLKDHYYFLGPYLVLALSFIFHLNHDGAGDWNDFAEFATIGRYYFLEFMQLPLWDPYAQGGVDMTLQPEANYFSPFYLLILLFGVPAGLKLNILLHVLIGYIGIQKWLGHYQFDKRHISFSSLFYLFSAFFISHISEGHLPFTAMFYLPWMLYTFNLKSPSKIFQTNFLIMIILFTSGSPNFVVYSFLLYIAALIRMTYKKDREQAISLVLSSILAALSTAFIIAPLLIGTDTISRSGFAEANSLFSIFQSYFLPMDRSLRYGYWAAHEYHNIIPYSFWLLAGFAIYRTIQKKSYQFNLYLALTLFGLWASLGGSEFYHLYGWLKQIPIVKETRVASRFSIFFILCLPFFAAASLKILNITNKLFLPILTLMTWGFIGHNLLYLEKQWKPNKDLSNLNYLGNGRYDTFSYAHDPTYIEKEKYLKPNVGIVAGMRSQTEGKKRVFKYGYFILSQNGKLKNWSPNQFDIQAETLEPIKINMYCNNMWESDSGELSCEGNHLELIPESPGTIKVFYNSETYQFFLLFSLVFFSLSLYLIYRKRRSIQ